MYSILFLGVFSLFSNFISCSNPPRDNILETFFFTFSPSAIKPDCINLCGQYALIVPDDFREKMPNDKGYFTIHGIFGNNLSEYLKDKSTLSHKTIFLSNHHLEKIGIDVKALNFSQMDIQLRINPTMENIITLLNEQPLNNKNNIQNKKILAEKAKSVRDFLSKKRKQTDVYNFLFIHDEKVYKNYFEALIDEQKNFNTFVWRSLAELFSCLLIVYYANEWYKKLGIIKQSLFFAFELLMIYQIRNNRNWAKMLDNEFDTYKQECIVK